VDYKEKFLDQLEITTEQTEHIEKLEKRCDFLEEVYDRHIVVYDNLIRDSMKLKNN